MTERAVSFVEDLSAEEKKINGIVTKVSSSKFVVFSEGKYYTLSARGVLKIKSSGIKVGDKVVFDENNVISVKERSSYFRRINVANIECVVIVIAHLPEPDYLLVDKMIVESRFCGAEVYIVINKIDSDDKQADYVAENYKKAVEGFFSVSARTGAGIDELKAAIKGKFTAFAGQSAVGKTSLINRIFNKDERVNELSKKTMRGKQTTTARTIHIDGDYMITDTPGFSSTQEFSVQSYDLALYYKDFYPFNGKCYYIGCTHTNEPDCLVKNALSRGDISKDRYNRYVNIFKEIKEYEKRKY